MAGKRILKKKSRGGIFLNLVIIAVVIAGIGLLAYPSVANWWNTRHNSHAVAAYEEQVANMDTALLESMRVDAKAYNVDLQTRARRWKPTDEQHAEYNALLNPDGTGVIGYVEIPKISVKLPVYHGTEEITLSVAIGHLEGSSLPVGGSGSHVVMSGHSALPSARLFTDLVKLKVGDKFYLHTLGETMAYEVREINTVLPDQFEYFDIDTEQDLCTLVTCTPYGVNSHRLLVTGARIKYAPATKTDGSDKSSERDDIKQPEGLSDEHKFGLLMVGAAATGLIVLCVVVNRKKKKGRRLE